MPKIQKDSFLLDTRYFFLQENIYHNWIYIADIANLMSNFDNFDVNQISSKFAQR